MALAIRETGRPANQYAAMPSFHFGWKPAGGRRGRRTVPGRAARIAVGLMPAVMLTAIMATANHFWLDALAGGTVALIGLWSARALNRR